MASIASNEASPSSKKNQGQFEPSEDNKLLKFYTTKTYSITHQVEDLNALMRRYPNGEYFDTDTQADNHGMSLRLSPCGIKANENGCFGIFLHCGYIKTMLDKMKATVKLLDDDGNQIGDHSTITMKYSDNTTWGPNRKFKTENMPNRFQIEFCVYKPVVWATPNFAIDVNRAFVQMFLDEYDTDVELSFVNADDGSIVTIPCHSFVLKSQSSVFRKMLNGKWKEGGEKGPVVIEDVEPEVMRVFLRILYGDRIEVDETFPSLVLHLLSLATRYDVKHIGNSLISCIDQNLVVESAVHTLQCAYQWDSEYPELKPKVLAFIAKNINSVFKTEGYQELLKSNNVTLIHDILQEVAKVQTTESNND